MQVGTLWCMTEELTQDDLGYMKKLYWLWNQLSDQQRYRITDAVNRGTLLQENSLHCFIGEAVGPRSGNTSYGSFGSISKIASAIFYDGPRYEGLLDRDISRDERNILDAIYYAKIGRKEHQYERANSLVRKFVFDIRKKCE